jgi:NADH:ubiquinone oxidoreductase subunit F (NADH-binding)
MTLTELRAPSVAAGGLPRLLPYTGDVSHAAHLELVGPLPPAGPELIAEVTKAGLRGRGGAAFPTGQKMASVAARRGAKVLVANGTEGEPLSNKDCVLLTLNPHLVLDGILAAAGAVGARRVILCVKRGQGAVLSALRRALGERHETPEIELLETPDRYVAGQETALVHWINGGTAQPTFGSRPFQRGVDGKPTLVDNVETLAHVGLIVRFGAAWFSTIGRGKETGSALVTVGGGIERPGVYEIPVGLPLVALLNQVQARPAQALLLGGYFGRWVDARLAGDATLCNEGLAHLGARFGCGVVVAIPEDACALAEVAAVAGWYSANSAGQCGACLFGLADIARAMQGVVGGDPSAEVAARRWTAMVRGRGACQFPDGAAMFVDSALDALATEVAEHRQGRCRRPYRNHLPVPKPGGWR